MSGASVSEPTEDYLRSILGRSQEVVEELLSMGFDKRVKVLAEVGRLWRNKLLSGEMEELVGELAGLTGYSTKNIELDLALVSEVLNEEALKSLFDHSLVGGHSSVDSPVEVDAGELVWNRPLGSVFIIASGNSVVPPVLAASTSLLAGNMTILRPSRSNFRAVSKIFDLISEVSSVGAYEAQVLEKAIQVLYMSHDSPALRYILEEAPVSAVNYWGGEPGRTRILSMTLKNPHRPRVLVNGPYTGVALVDEESASLDVARKLARDVVLYDQQLCSSPTVTLFIGSREALTDFSKKLSGALEEVGSKFPVELTEGSFYRLHVLRKSLELKRVNIAYSRSAINPWTLVTRKLDELDQPLLPWSTHSRRVLEIVGIENLTSLSRALELLVKRLSKLGIDGIQTASCAVSGSKFNNVLGILAKFGVHRVVPVGESFLRTPAEPYDGEFIPRYFTRVVYVRTAEMLDNLRQRGVHLP